MADEAISSPFLPSNHCDFWGSTGTLAVQTDPARYAMTEFDNLPYLLLRFDLRKRGVNMKSRCETCSMRKRAEKNPKSILSKIWRWHTGWCPGWKAYQKELAEQKVDSKS